MATTKYSDQPTHKDTHKSGGSDPFAVGDLLIAQAHLTIIKNLVTVSTTSATEVDLQTVTLPANTLGATGGLRIRAVMRKVSGTETGKVYLYWGSTLLGSFSGTANSISIFDVLVWNTATGAQRAWVLRITGTGAANAYVTSTEDTTAAVTIKTTGNSAGVDQMDSLMLIVEILERT